MPYTDNARKYNRKYYQKNHEKRLEYTRKYRKEHSKKIKEFEKNRHLINKYGITYDQKNQMVIDQGGLCASCKQPLGIKPQNICVDHDHDTGKVRKILCNSCNLALGYMRESPVLVSGLLEYAYWCESLSLLQNETMFQNETNCVTNMVIRESNK